MHVTPNDWGFLLAAVGLPAFDPTVNFGQVLTIFTIALAGLGVWLKNYKTEALLQNTVANNVVAISKLSETTQKLTDNLEMVKNRTENQAVTLARHESRWQEVDKAQADELRELRKREGK